MSLYSREDERRIRSQTLVREWTKSGLLDPAQGAALETELRVDVRRTNVFLRAGLGVFTILVIAASVLLVGVIFDLDRQIPIALLTATASAACFALARMLITQQRFYRFGVEEAFAIGSAVLIAISAAAFTDALATLRSGHAALIAALLTGAAACLAIYRHFGYVYAAIGAIACVATVPFQLNVPAAAQHALAAASLAAAFGIARAQRARYGQEYPGDDYDLVQAAAWAGLYLTLNLQLTSTRVGGPFYGFTYAMIWALPAVGLYLAIRDRDRPLLRVSLLMALGSLLTNKAYLGWPRHEWDPILLGIFLMAAAVVVRRWLSAGADGQRSGFTAARILSKEAGAVTILGTASARFHPAAPSFPEPEDTGFHGGRSGGGGAAGGF